MASNRLTPLIVAALVALASVGVASALWSKTLTVDGNNPLCGREVVFTLEILTVRDATDEETRAGGTIGAQPDIDPSLTRPV